MARTPKADIREEDLHGFKHFKLLLPMLEKLHENACARDCQWANENGSPAHLVKGVIRRIVGPSNHPP